MSTPRELCLLLLLLMMTTKLVSFSSLHRQALAQPRNHIPLHQPRCFGAAELAAGVSGIKKGKTIWACTGVLSADRTAAPRFF